MTVPQLYTSNGISQKSPATERPTNVNPSERMVKHDADRLRLSRTSASSSCRSKSSGRRPTASMASKISFFLSLFSHEGDDPTEGFLVDLPWRFHMGFKAAPSQEGSRQTH